MNDRITPDNPSEQRPERGSPALEILRVALPAIVTMLSYVVMQFVDTLIVARLEPGAIAAVGNGGIFAFVLGSFMFGMLGIINTFVSQNYGAGRPEKGAAYAWNGLWLCLAAWLFVMLPAAALWPMIDTGVRAVLSIEGDPGVRANAFVYGRILLLGMVFVLAARGLSHYFYGIHRAQWVMGAAIIANAINIPASMGLVYGWWGLPRLEIAGAAIGTVIGSVVEIAILMGVFLGPKFARELKTRCGWRPSLAHIKDIWRLGWPAGLMLGNELCCWWLFMGFIVADFGKAHNDAAWIVLRYMHVSFMPAVGLSMAVTAVVGKVVGAGRSDLATNRMMLGLSMAVAYMGACAIAMVVFREYFVGVFAEEMGQMGGADGATSPEYIAEVIRVGSAVLIVAAAFQVFDAVAITVVGALRGAGDTVWPGIATALLSWTFIIGAGYGITRVAPGLGSLGAWIGAALFIISLAIALSVRWRSGKWMAMAVAGPGQEVYTGPSGNEMGVVEPSTAAPEVGAMLEPAGGVVRRRRAVESEDADA